jgi:histidine triad (HIT) family protein
MVCIFCDIIKGKSKTNILFENDKFIAFRDIKPAVEKCHFLMIPKLHIPTVNDLKKNDLEMCNKKNIV